MRKPGWGIFLKSIYSDEDFPTWWLDRIFKKFLKEKYAEYNKLGISWWDGDKIIKEAKEKRNTYVNRLKEKNYV